MNPSRILLALAASAACLVGVGAAGCGSSGTTTTVTDHQTTTVFVPGTGGDTASAPAGDSSTGGGSAGGPLSFDMGDLFFKPDTATAAAGSVKVSVSNIGATTHEWVLAKTDLDPASLPTLPNGEVDEEQLDSPGEIPDVAPGASGDTALDLKPGKYVYFCNLPGHYAGGMYGALEVTGG